MNRDAKGTADFPIGQYHVFTVTVCEFRVNGRRLKKSASVVLASFRSSMYSRGYDSGLHSLQPCWTNFLSRLWIIAPLPKTHKGTEIHACHERFCEAPWIGYTSHHATWLLATDIVSCPHDAACSGDTFIYTGPGHHIGPAFLSRCGAHIRSLSGEERSRLRSDPDRLFD